MDTTEIFICLDLLNRNFLSGLSSYDKDNIPEKYIKALQVLISLLIVLHEI